MERQRWKSIGVRSRGYEKCNIDLLQKANLTILAAFNLAFLWSRATWSRFLESVVLLNRLIDSMQLGQVKVLINYLIRRKQIAVNQTLAVLSNVKHNLFWKKVWSDSGLWLLSWSHSDLGFMLTYRHYFLSPATILRKNWSLWLHDIGTSRHVEMQR